MSILYYYNYAAIDLSTNMCVGVYTTTYVNTETESWVEIPVYDEEYCFKYYNWDDNKFYYDAAYTQEYISPLL